MRPSSLAIAFGVGRVLFGGAMLAVPGQITRVWVGAEAAPAVILARCLGGRDIAIGAGLALAAGRGGDPRLWLAGGVLADTAAAIPPPPPGAHTPPHAR